MSPTEVEHLTITATAREGYALTFTLDGILDGILDGFQTFNITRCHKKKVQNVSFAVKKKKWAYLDLIFFGDFLQFFVAHLEKLCGREAAPVFPSSARGCR